MSYNQFCTTTLDSHDEYVWPTQGGLALPDIQAISNLAGITYGYDGGRVTSSVCAEEVDFADRGRFHQYDVEHIQTLSVQYRDTYEAYSQEQQLQESSHAGDDDYYFANGLLSTHRFLKGTPMIQSQPLCEPTRSSTSFVLDTQDSFASRSDSQEPFPTSLTLHPFPSIPADDPIDGADSHPKIDHDFLLPNQHSTYSELSANLVYMAAESTRLYEQETPVARQKQEGVKRRKREKATTRIKSVDKQLKRGQGDSPRAPGSSFKRTKTDGKDTRRRSPEPVEGSGAQISPLLPERLNLAGSAQASQDNPMKHIPPPRAVGRTSTCSAIRPSTKKKLGLACLFCRERKIACGRPSESNPDQTCNQCARRCFKCEYPIESRRGQHKRPKIKPIAD